jgi:hypothetical protein
MVTANGSEGQPRKPFAGSRFGHHPRTWRAAAFTTTPSTGASSASLSNSTDSTISIKASRPLPTMTPRARPRPATGRSRRPSTQATNASRLWECAPASPRSPPRSDRRSGATLGGGSSTSPSKRLCTKRRCTYPPSPARSPTVPVLSNPSAQADTIFDRNASDGADFARRYQRSNCSRLSSANSSTALGRPVLTIHGSTTYSTNSWRRTLVDEAGDSVPQQ